MPVNPADAPLPLTNLDYPEVRAAIQMGLGSSKVTDDVIAMSIFQGDAEDEVKRRIPTWETKLGDDRIRRAAIFLTAARIAPRMTEIIQADAINEAASWRKNATDWGAVAADLQKRADDLIGQVIAEDVTTTPRPFTFFTVASGTRGKW